MVSVVSVSARRNNRYHFEDKQSDMKAFFEKRNAFIIEKVGLNKEEADAFIPLENELMNKKFEIGKECRRIERELKDRTDKSDEEYQRLLKCREEVKEKRKNLDKEYLDKFKDILSAEQILKYENADREFFDEFMRDKRR
jgi:hypothetical protein